MNQEIKAVVLSDEDIKGTIELEPLRGPQGLSAYEIYVNNLPQGEEPLSEQDWLDSFSKANYYRLYENGYMPTSGISTIAIDLPITYKESDIVIVSVNGLTLVRDVDYTITNGDIVLTEPIYSGSYIYYAIPRTIAATEDDYEDLRGPKSTWEDGQNEVKFVRVMTEEDAGDVAISNGQLIFTAEGTVYFDYNNERITVSSGSSPSGGDSAPIGTIYQWTGSTAPDGYLICDGTTYSKSQYPDLYDALDSEYQISAEQFKVPDFRGLIPIGAGTHQDANSKSKTFNLNTEYGEYEHTLTGQEMPKHAHNLKWNTTQHEGGGNGSALPFNSTNTNFIGNDISAMIESGGSQSHNNIQPSLAVNFIIKAIKSETTMAEVENSLTSDSTTNAPSIHAVNENLVSITESQLNTTSTACGEITVNKLRKQNKTVVLDFEAYATNFINGYNTVGSIPSEYLPLSTSYYGDVLLYFTCAVSGLNKIVCGRITSTGNVEIYQDEQSANERVGYIPTTMQFRIHENWFVE